MAPPIPLEALSDNVASNSNKEDIETEYVTFETVAEGKHSPFVILVLLRFLFRARRIEIQFI